MDLEEGMGKAKGASGNVLHSIWRRASRLSGFTLLE